jgi:FkbM family methyltransferase
VCRAWRSLRHRGLRATWRIARRRLVFHPVLNPWWLDPKRIATRRFEQKHTEPFDPGLTAFGNYWLDAARLSTDAVIYSLGVGTQIEFDLALAARGIPVHLFDPTPRSVDFMRGHAGNRLLRYQPIGVWVHDGQARFHFDRAAAAAAEVCNASITDLFDRTESFEAPVATLPSLMAHSGHDRIDVLKADIEGAAVAVLEHALDHGIEPAQIVVELERPRGLREMHRFFARVAALLDRLRARGYRVIRLPRRAPYYSIEVLALRGAAALPPSRRARSQRCASSGKCQGEP